MLHFRKQIFEIIEKSENDSIAGKIFNWFIVSLILLNIAAVIIESFNIQSESFLLGLHVFEFVSVIIFTVEFIVRVWTAPDKYPDSKFPRLKYIFSFMAVIDLLAILPFYLPFIINVNLKYLRILRLFRLFRILKLNRYNNSLDLIGRVLKNEKEKLIMTTFIIFILLLFSSSTMYYIENNAQPDKYTDILTTLWWAVATLTTIGYGDIYPITPIGKLLGGMIAILGMALVALPSGIITVGFINESKTKKTTLICPCCGKEIINDI